MAKHKSPQELMAERNPLINRTAVAPVDIYNQRPEPAVAPVASLATPVKTPEPKITPAVKARKTTPVVAKTENENSSDIPYSTYLFKRQVKGIKLRAIDQDVKDKHIVQQAIEEYFVNHPL